MKPRSATITTGLLLTLAGLALAFDLRGAGQEPPAPDEKTAAAAEPQEEPGPQAAAGSRSHRLSDVAFEVLLAGGEMPPLPVTFEEWEGLIGRMRGLADILDEGVFLNLQLAELIEQKATLLFHHVDLPGVERRVKEVMDRLSSGEDFSRVAKIYSDDRTSGRMDGDFGRYRFGSLFYPVHPDVYLQEVGKIGAYYTKYGVYVLRLEDKLIGSKPYEIDVQLSAIVLKYAPGQGLSREERARMNRRIRVRTAHERFRRVLPPALQLPPPPGFGPSDIAPLGAADTPLLQLSDLDEKNLRPAGPKPPASDGG